MSQNKKYTVPKSEKKKRAMDIFYLIVILLVFEFIGMAMLIFPRSTESENEKRKLEEFPKFTVESYFSGEYTAQIAVWFSDTVPFRDNLTQLSVDLRELRGFRQDGIKLHGVTAPPQESEPPVSSPEQTRPASTTTKPKPEESSAPAESGTEPEQTTTKPQGNHEIDPVEEQPINEDDAVNITNNGIAVVGTRALMLYGGSYSVGESYAQVINKYKEVLGDDVNVYSMIIPTSCEFYSPPSVEKYCGSQLNNINHVIANLRDDVTAVDVYTPLSQHTKEDIYMRTDHHWASLGAYYAAQAFAQAAGVPFMELDKYERRVVHDYVGTMYAYSEDIVLKNNPEDFFYYVPTGIDYTTTYYNYIIEDGAITGAEEPYEGSFFMRYGDGNGMAYCTFMGGDSKIVHVSTGAGTGRKLAIFKDSFGNALPGFLFGSFDDIYVIDMRYFTHNAYTYLTENGVTDVLFANNAFHAATASTVTYYNRFLTQEDWGF